MEVLTQLATGTKLRDINWVDVAVQGAVGAVTSGTIPFRFLKTASKVVKATAKIAKKNVVVSTAAEVFSQRNDKNKSIGKTATIGVQTSIDTLIDSGTTYLLRGTKAKIATAVVRTVQQAFSLRLALLLKNYFQGIAYCCSRKGPLTSAKNSGKTVLAIVRREKATGNMYGSAQNIIAATSSYDFTEAPFLFRFFRSLYHLRTD